MIKSYSEVPHTIEALKFYIDRGDIAVKEFKNKANNLELLISEAKRRLKAFDDAPKKEVMN